MGTERQRQPQNQLSANGIHSASITSAVKHVTNPVLQLQRMIGNQAMQRLLKVGVQAESGNTNRFTHKPIYISQLEGSDSLINRQTPPANAATPAFSVNQANYLQLVNQALQNQSGRIPAGNTFTPVVQPILQSMLNTVVWRDSNSTNQGGGPYRYTVPGATGTGTTLNLTLILDDMIDPPEAGLFQASGTDGRIFIRVRRNTDSQGLTEVLYHESMHMMSWILNNYGNAAAPGVNQRAVRGLEMSHFRVQIANIRGELESLAQSSNSRRRTNGRSEITADRLDYTSRWLMEEVQVRAETEVFQQTLQVESQRGQQSQVYITTQQYGAINSGMVERYVYEFSHTFTPDDKNGMTNEERQTLRALTEMLEGFFQFHVRRRFSLTAHTINIPRTQPQFTPSPLRPPNFTNRIGEATGGEPF